MLSAFFLRTESKVGRHSLILVRMEKMRNKFCLKSVKNAMVFFSEKSLIQLQKSRSYLKIKINYFKTFYGLRKSILHSFIM